MKIEETINHIKDLIVENNSIKPNMVVFELEKEALWIAIEALKKQVPTKTVEQGFIYCGKCDMRIESIGWDWRPHCGQAIDWGDGEKHRVVKLEGINNCYE